MRVFPNFSTDRSHLKFRIHETFSEFSCQALELGVLPQHICEVKNHIENAKQDCKLDSCMLIDFDVNELYTYLLCEYIPKTQDELEADRINYFVNSLQTITK